MSHEEDDDPLGANSPPSPLLAPYAPPLPLPRVPLPLPPAVRPPSSVITHPTLCFWVLLLTLVAAAQHIAGLCRCSRPTTCETATSSSSSAASAHSAAGTAASYNFCCCSCTAAAGTPLSASSSAQRASPRIYCSTFIICCAAERRSVGVHAAATSRSPAHRRLRSCHV
jgi:hypothetical protein